MGENKINVANLEEKDLCTEDIKYVLVVVKEVLGSESFGNLVTGVS